MECNLIDRDVDMLFYAEQQIEMLMEALSDGITEENIDTGTSGMLLLILDMYQRTQKPSYLAFANDAILRLVEWCRSHPTNNYALYTGRGGVAYLLIRRYMLDGDRSYLHLATELLKPANDRFLHSRYTTDYLYDGRAGTLLVLAYLYRMTGEG